MTDLEVLLGRLGRLADGALRTIAQRGQDGLYRSGAKAGPQPKKFWEGYRQAVADITDLTKE